MTAYNKLDLTRHQSTLLSRQLDMIRPTSPPNFAGHGHQSQRRYPCSTHCPPATTLVITLQVRKMRVVLRTHPLILPVVSLSHPHPTFYPSRWLRFHPDASVVKTNEVLSTN